MDVEDPMRRTVASSVFVTAWRSRRLCVLFLLAGVSLMTLAARNLVTSADRALQVALLGSGLLFGFGMSRLAASRGLRHGGSSVLPPSEEGLANPTQAQSGQDRAD